MSERYVVSVPSANGNPMWHVIDTQAEHMTGFKIATFSPAMPQVEMWVRLIADQLNRGEK
jgi:hypothetical protein